MPYILYKEVCTKTLGSLYICGTSISVYSIVQLYRITFSTKEELTAASKTSTNIVYPQRTRATTMIVSPTAGRAILRKPKKIICALDGE
jgi:hypothetical protein